MAISYQLFNYIMPARRFPPLSTVATGRRKQLAKEHPASFVAITATILIRH